MGLRNASLDPKTGLLHIRVTLAVLEYPISNTEFPMIKGTHFLYLDVDHSLLDIDYSIFGFQYPIANKEFPMISFYDLIFFQCFHLFVAFSFFFAVSMLRNNIEIS